MMGFKQCSASHLTEHLIIKQTIHPDNQVHLQNICE